MVVDDTKLMWTHFLELKCSKCSNIIYRYIEKHGKYMHPKRLRPYMTKCCSCGNCINNELLSNKTVSKRYVKINRI